jgi:hypothetical protein
MGMKRGFLYFSGLLILGSLFGLLAITPCENACGQDCCLKGFINFHFELEIESPNPVTPPLDSQGGTHAFLLHSLKGTLRQKVDLLTNILLL